MAALSQRCEFRDHRYATDSGPACPKGCTPDGESLWVCWVTPGQSSYAQCACCHHAVAFMAPEGDPTIHEVKAALLRALTVKEYTQGSLHYLDPFQRWDYRSLRTTGREMVAYFQHKTDLDRTSCARMFVAAVDNVIGGL